MSGHAQDRQTCLIVLDASNSMTGYKKGTQKMRIAKQVIGDLVSTMPQNIDLGLVVYGHRKKSDCEDIELLIPAGPVNAGSFMDTVNAIRANGKTPLTNSLEFAAEALGSASNGASIILLTDGLETCKRDPCEAVAALAASGVRLTTHVIAFDLRSDQASQIECIATQTGGQFLAADNATELLSAMTVAITEVASGNPTAMAAPSPPVAPSAAVVTTPASPPRPEPVPEPAIVEDPVVLTVPESVVAGANFEVQWDGPTMPDDFLVIVPDWEKDGVFRNRQAVNQDNPVTMTALIRPQNAEVRLISSSTSNVLGRAPIVISEVEASVSGPAEAIMGSQVEVEWTGPSYDGDFVTIVSKEADEGTWKSYKYARRDQPVLEITGLPDSGMAEIRYISGQGRRTLARQDIRFVEALVSLSSIDEAVAGSKVPIEWEGPANRGDFITIVPIAMDEGKYLKYAYAKAGETAVEVTAPMETGNAEIRYIAGQGRATLARIPITIKGAEVSLMAPMDAVAGSAVSIDWEGPGNQGDFITIVPTYLEENKYLKYAYAQPGKNSVKVTAPIDAGDAEIRYLSGSGRQVLARVPITINPPDVSITAPEEAIAGSMIKVTWNGPANKGDFLTIVSRYANEGTYSKASYAQRGQETLDIQVPMETGESEIRYLAGGDRRTLARVPLQVNAAEIVLNAVGEATVGNKIKVEWQGPANNNDFITLVNRSAGDSYYHRPVQVHRGKPVIEVLAPMTPGEMEIRYLAGSNRAVLGRVSLTVKEAEVEMELPESVVVRKPIQIQWNGPQNENDYLTIVPVGSPENQRGPLAYANQGSPITLNGPGEPGEYEVRYISGQGRLILGTAPITIESQP